MKLFRFDPEVGKPIDAYGSLGLVISKLLRIYEEMDIKCAYLSPNGVVGYHQTTKDQLFAVVQGEGWVRGETPESRCPILTGQAAFWDAGEWHESGTETGMVVILVEGNEIDPAKTMPAV